MTDEARTAWYEAWAKAWASLPEIGRDRKATIAGKEGKQGYEYSYASLSDVLDAVRPVLKANGLAVAQDVTSPASGQVGVATRVYHTDGWVEVFGPIVFPAGGDARQVGSTITYARRYGLLAALGVAPDEDTDAAPQKAAAKSRTKKAEAGVDLHEQAWAKAVEAGTAAGWDLRTVETAFVDALASVKVKRIETQEQHDAVLAEIKT